MYPYSSCEVPGNFPDFVLCTSTGCSWQHLSFIVVLNITLYKVPRAQWSISHCQKASIKYHTQNSSEFRFPHKREVFPGFSCLGTHTWLPPPPVPSPFMELPKSQLAPYALGAGKLKPADRQLSDTVRKWPNCVCNQTFLPWKLIFKKLHFWCRKKAWLVSSQRLQMMTEKGRFSLCYGNCQKHMSKIKSLPSLGMSR